MAVTKHCQCLDMRLSMGKSVAHCERRDLDEARQVSRAVRVFRSQDAPGKQDGVETCRPARDETSSALNFIRL